MLEALGASLDQAQPLPELGGCEEKLLKAEIAVLGLRQCNSAAGSDCKNLETKDRKL